MTARIGIMSGLGLISLVSGVLIGLGLVTPSTLLLVNGLVAGGAAFIAVPALIWEWTK